MTRQLEQLMNWELVRLDNISFESADSDSQDRRKVSTESQTQSKWFFLTSWNMTARSVKVEAPLMEGRQFYGSEEQLLSAIIVKEQL